VTISGRLAWVGMNIDIGDSRTSGLIWDLRAWTARASLDKKISGGWSSLMRNGNGRREWDGSDLVVIVKDGLVHSEGLSVYPLGVGWIVGGITKKLAWHVRFQNRGPFFHFDLFVLIFLIRSCL
jgi:hypothetical protein